METDLRPESRAALRSVMNHQAVIFDLDGTLLDTLQDIADSVNRVLAARGLSGHATEAYRTLVGDGSAVLVTRALPEKHRRPEIINSCLQGYLDDYQQNWHQSTRPYDGIQDLLVQLQDRRIPMAVVTNKPHRFTSSMMARYFGSFHFHPVLGQQDGIPKKPDPHLALAAAQEMGVAPSDCYFVGDSATDMHTARNAAMHPIGAGWGFRTAEELYNAGALTVLDHPLELLDWLAHQGPR